MSSNIQSLEEYGNKISKIQFDSYCYCRQPYTQYFSREIEWYSLFDNRLLASIVLDYTDSDYGFIILGRDRNKLFRCIEVSTVFYKTLKLAQEGLCEVIFEKYKNNTQDCYPQGGINNRRIELFRDIIPQNKQHKIYKILAQENRFEAARNLITEIANSFIDNDGHYEREFQSVNFHARLWELYLHMYFNHNQNFYLVNNHASPDFELEYFDEKLFVEAVTVNPSTNELRPDLPNTSDFHVINKKLKNFMPIKFGSTLLSKMNKKYWDLPHVKNSPLIIAIHDYHNDNAMVWSRTALSGYLYGLEENVKKGKPYLKKVTKHKWQGKEIDSGFFFNTENSENISAVLFSNQATITKFNRMGKLGGLGSGSVKMMRMSMLLDPDPTAFMPLVQFLDIDDPEYEESWSEGLVMYHNPKAKFPVNVDAFPDITHVFFDERQGLIAYGEAYAVLNSITYCFIEKK